MPQPPSQTDPSSSTPPQSVEVTPGLVVMPTYGSIKSETAEAWAQLQVAAKGTPVKFMMVSGALVDKARNEAVKMLLEEPKFQWLWFLDGDMVFSSDIFVKMMVNLQKLEWADVIGGYCNLKGKPYLPTIDRGSGRWESHDAGMGYVEVIRTGAACVATRRRVYETMEAPWYDVRQAFTPLDSMAEFDNYARQRFDGTNPFTHYPEWSRLIQCAKDDNKPMTGPQKLAHSVGEDSNFCDKARALGFRIVVDTNIVCGHIDKKVIWPQDHTNAMREGRNQLKHAVGLMV